MPGPSKVGIRMINFAIEIMQPMLFMANAYPDCMLPVGIVEPDDSTISTSVREVSMKATPVIEKASC